MIQEFGPEPRPCDKMLHIPKVTMRPVTGVTLMLEMFYGVRMPMINIMSNSSTTSTREQRKRDMSCSQSTMNDESHRPVALRARLTLSSNKKPRSLYESTVTCHSSLSVPCVYYGSYRYLEHDHNDTYQSLEIPLMCTVSSCCTIAMIDNDPPLTLNKIDNAM